MKQTMQEYVEMRLQHWAEWWCRYEDNGLGYPSRSMEARLKDCGGFWVKTTGRKTEPGNPLAEETEFLICEIARQNKKIAEALRAQYLKPGTMQYKAKLLGYSSTQYKVYLEMGKQWLSGRFSGANIGV